VRGLRIEADVELRCRGGVAAAGDGAAHDDQAANPLWQRRVQAQRQRQIGKRAEHHEGQLTRAFAAQAQHRQRGMFGLGAPIGWLIAGVAEAVAAVHEGGIGDGMQERLRAAGEHRNR
jgi:hypothetical protein